MNSLTLSCLPRFVPKVSLKQVAVSSKYRIVGIEGESGAEVITFDFFEVDIARTPSAAALRNRKKKTADVPPVRVSFPLSDVDRANLLAELNFKG